jgi:Asp/Glu/hydantoin racemase
VSSINNEDDAATSARACFPELKPKLADFDAFLICCYSDHPLVEQLREEIANQNLYNKAVAGIFEASVATCLLAINLHDKFGIISTGKQWQEILAKAVSDIMGSKATDRYAGCETTGLSAGELHTTPPEITKEKIKLATKRLLGKKAKAICLGCAGMAGMDTMVRKACIEHLGENEGRRIKIVDGVISGIYVLEVALRATQ